MPLINYYVAHVFDAQLRLATLIGGADWTLDPTTGLLSFGTQYQWCSQLLGTDSESSHTWRWAWADTGRDTPDHLLTAGRALKAYGEQHGIPELSAPELPHDQIDGHALALLASGLCDANAYFHCPSESGSRFVLIMDEDFPSCPDSPLQRLATVFPQAIASLYIPDHRLALVGYLDLHDLAYRQEGDTVVVTGNDESVLTATFDDQRRLSVLEITPSRPAAEPTESWDQFWLRLALRG